MIKYFEVNENGFDYIVGDIHGCFEALQEQLDYIGFDKTNDRLFSVGDLVDRGPQSNLADVWLAKPWFHAVRGNHEQMAIDFFRKTGEFQMDADLYERNGGQWFLDLPDGGEQLRFVTAFEAMPYLIELKTKDGSTVGIVHAECVDNDWASTKAEVWAKSDLANQVCLWERDKFNYHDSAIVTGVDVVVVGHTPLKTCNVLGNTYYIDTGKVFGGKFTIIQANTMEIVNYG